SFAPCAITPRVIAASANERLVKSTAQGSESHRCDLASSHRAERPVGSASRFATRGPQVDSRNRATARRTGEWVVTEVIMKSSVAGEIDRAEDDTTLRTYVLDTSVLLSDPRALFRFAEH